MGDDVGQPMTAIVNPPTSQHDKTSGRRVALALGGGGARGYAHIGVINELHDRGYEIAAISGSSMGALVGGLEAAGVLDEFSSWATTLTQRAVLRLLDPAWASAGIFRAEKILNIVRNLLGDVTIETLPIPFTAMATDLIAGKSVWLQHGPLDAAIRASIAIPGLIAPYILDGQILADGGILDPLPMAALTPVDAELRIAVNLNGEETHPRDQAPPRESRAAVEWLNRLLRNTSAVLDTSGARSTLSRVGTSSRTALAWGLSDEQPGQTTTAQPQLAPKLTSFEVMNRTIDIMQTAAARTQLAAHPPDLLIDIPRTTCRSLDFHRAAEIIEVGRQAAIRTLDTSVQPRSCQP